MIEPKVDPSKYDPRELGLKAGLEIHQQLNTRAKLFCNCPTRLSSEDEPGDEFVRQLRPTRSELGEVDIAALFEWRKGRMYHYHAPRATSCLVEADEEPPHEINQEAVVIGLAVALALGATPVDEIHVMRKIVIDGSNTTGFQRTAIIALGGSIELESGKKIGIATIAVEEDASRKLREEGRYVHYMLDRLGIPLIEISTEPDIETPEEAYEAALAIGQLLRLTGRVKRGIGTIRQDLNVSIRGGVKTEIKGVQRLELIPKIVLYEAIRQKRLLEIRDELKRRGVRQEDIDAQEIADVTDVFKKTKSKIIARAVKRGGRVLALKLPGFHGLLGVEVQPGRRFGTELADYARFWGGVGGLFHTDELPGYGISAEEVEELYKLLNAKKGWDAIVIVADEEPKARKALEAVKERAKMALEGIPKETRAAQEDGTTKFMRPQPGSARMYPETDIPPLEVTKELLNKARKIVPEKPHEKLEKLVRKYGLSEQLARQIIRDIHLDLFEKLAEKYGSRVAPSYIASLFTNILRSLAREGVPVSNLSDTHIEEIVRAIAEGKVSKDAVPDLIKYLAENPSRSVEEAVRELGIETVPVEKVEKLVEEAVKQLEAEIRARGLAALNKVMGRVMPKLRGKVDGKLVASIAKRKIEELLGGN
ncbi:Glu-tRNA(Gln) amidotransferase subunit GatE [Hyperthermus butylicus]|uniref:Glutamyl-tRNA(Gln) amidotransferase subunit E n=1 Tax=Hyperthermus butylicus (strain DSM 5456 / JCM 9403 / PLM1-5) TaxID=415426 RepID=A2BLB4_HYPBU|nr:Glu-tRNA(Gln) amidotransferase subunit GatE [Hyperthermus butylicus]ABM80775.1 glutamyl-tRNA(Gln) amidotransferase subunit E [Hyperthermus butylicus DSM 5456]